MAPPLLWTILDNSNNVRLCERGSAMRTKLRKTVLALALVAGGLGLAGTAQAAAIIDNGVVQLGVRDLGDLNVGGGPPSGPSGTTVVGLRSLATTSDSTSPGCTCEGWGVAIQSLGIAGFANSAVGTANLALVSFTSTASTARSVVNVLSPSGAPVLRVTHDYAPNAGTSMLYQVNVSIQNISGQDIAAGDLLYRRVMDWDIPFPGIEHVDIQGVPAALGIANGTNIFRTDNNGFNSGNPLTFSPFGLTNVNFTGATGDIGAMFDFQFEALADGATRTFTTFYGVAPTKADADLARALVDGDPSDIEIGLYSYGYPGTQTSGYPPGTPSVDPTTGAPNTFIFGFGVAGGILTPPPPPPNGVPEPGTLALVGLGLMGLAALRSRKRR